MFDSNQMDERQMADAVADLVKAARLTMPDELNQIAVLKSAASQIEHRLQAEAMRQALYNALNKGK